MPVCSSQTITPRYLKQNVIKHIRGTIFTHVTVLFTAFTNIINGKKSKVLEIYPCWSFIKYYSQEEVRFVMVYPFFS